MDMVINNNEPVFSRIKFNDRYYEPYAEDGNLYIPQTIFDGIDRRVYYLKIPHDVLKEALEYKEEQDQ